MPDDVVRGFRLGTGYHLALLRGHSSDFNDVNEDKNLVEIQEIYAASYLRARANLHAIKMVLPPEEFATLEPQLFPAMDLSYGVDLHLGEAVSWRLVTDDVAIDERGEARLRRRSGDERWNQLARRDLHAAGLSGHEEDQVEADVHIASIPASPASGSLRRR